MPPDETLYLCCCAAWEPGCIDVNGRKAHRVREPFWLRTTRAGWVRRRRIGSPSRRAEEVWKPPRVHDKGRTGGRGSLPATRRVFCARSTRPALAVANCMGG